MASDRFDLRDQPGNQEAAASDKKRIPSCIPCRERHLRCSKERPACSNCRGAKHHRRCNYESKPGLRFRQSRISEALTSRSAQAPEEIDHGSGAARVSNVHQWDAEQAQEITNSHSYLSPPSNLSSLSEPHQSNVQFDPVHGAANILSTLAAPSSSSSEHHQQQLQPEHGFGPSSSSTTNSQERDWDNHGRQHHLRDARIISDRTECKVFAFYVDSLGSWLDIGSPNRYFQARIPQLAMADPLLYFACLACSSQVMALRGEVDKSTEESFNGKVLEILIPLLSSEQATRSNSALLATTVILRMSEQFMDAGHDSQRHLNGAASLFINGTRWSHYETDLATAAFWTHLRESIRVCFLHESPCQIPLENLVYQDTVSAIASASDEAWTNHMTYLLLQTINLCWSAALSHAHFDKLEKQVDEWKSSLPLSFRPWCFSTQTDSPFPRVQCFESWHVVAWQFYYVAKVMLSVYCKKANAFSSLHDVRRRIENEVVVPTRLLCGICISSTSNVGTTLNGSHLMAWSGQYLYSREEQEYLVEYLERFSDRTRWPTQSSLQRLRSRWDEQTVSWID